MNKLLFIALLLVLISATRRRRRCKVTGYWKNGRRRSFKITKSREFTGNYRDLSQADDKIFKLKFSSNCCAKIYEDKNYSRRESSRRRHAKYATLCSSNGAETVRLSEWKRKISSIKTFNKGDRCTANMYGNNGVSQRYAGEVRLVDNNDAYYKVVFNKQDCCAWFYEHSDFVGRLGLKCYGSGNALPSHWKYKISSFKVFKQHITPCSSCRGRRRRSRRSLEESGETSEDSKAPESGETSEDSKAPESGETSEDSKVPESKEASEDLAELEEAESGQDVLDDDIKKEDIGEEEEDLEDDDNEDFEDTDLEDDIEDSEDKEDLEDEDSEDEQRRLLNWLEAQDEE